MPNIQPDVLASSLTCDYKNLQTNISNIFKTNNISGNLCLDFQDFSSDIIELLKKPNSVILSKSELIELFNNIFEILSDILICFSKDFPKIVNDFLENIDGIKLLSDKLN